MTFNLRSIFARLTRHSEKAADDSALAPGDMVWSTVSQGFWWVSEVDLQPDDLGMIWVRIQRDGECTWAHAHQLELVSKAAQLWAIA